MIWGCRTKATKGSINILSCINGVGSRRLQVVSLFVITALSTLLAVPNPISAASTTHHPSAIAITQSNEPQGRRAGDDCPPNGLPTEKVVVTVSFPPGWNLVGRPVGSCLVGAVDPTYFIPFGNTDSSDYIAGSVRNARGAGGDWAYFPTGGSIQLAAGSQLATSTVSFAAQPGGWYLVSDPSPYGPAAPVDGVDQNLTYDPATGAYVEESEIPVGHGAWIHAKDGPLHYGPGGPVVGILLEAPAGP